MVLELPLAMACDLISRLRIISKYPNLPPGPAVTCYPTGNLDNVDRNLNTQFSQRELGELPWPYHIEYSTTVSTDHDNNDMQRLFNQPFTQNKLPTLRGTSLNEISRFVHSLDQTDIADAF